MRSEITSSKCKNKRVNPVYQKTNRVIVLVYLPETQQASNRIECKYNQQRYLVNLEPEIRSTGKRRGAQLNQSS